MDDMHIVHGPIVVDCTQRDLPQGVETVRKDVRDAVVDAYMVARHWDEWDVLGSIRNLEEAFGPEWRHLGQCNPVIVIHGSEWEGI